MVNDESGVLVIVEQIRDSEFPELVFGQETNDVADVVASEGPDWLKNGYDNCFYE